jgi:hypothetical protein
MVHDHGAGSIKICHNHREYHDCHNHYDCHDGDTHYDHPYHAYQYAPRGWYIWLRERGANLGLGANMGDFDGSRPVGLVVLATGYGDGRHGAGLAY